MGFFLYESVIFRGWQSVSEESNFQVLLNTDHIKAH